MKNCVLAFVAIVLSVLLQSCSTVDVKKSAVIKAHTVVLLPIDSLQQELTYQSASLYEQLAQSLVKKRFQVLTQDKDSFKPAFDYALAQSGAVYDPTIGKFLPVDRSVYLKALIDFYAAQQDFDVILVPELLIRSANVTGDNASWDSVERKVELAKTVDKPYKPLTTVRGVSLKLSAYTRQGAVLFHQYAGISLPYRIDYQTKPPTLVIKSVLFTDKEQKQAVDLSIKAFSQQVKFYAK